MKLHWSPRSPYVRKVMIVAHETGQADSLDLVRTVVTRLKPNADLMTDNPLSRIPTFVLDDGTVISGSYHICEYLDSRHSGHKMIPPPGQALWAHLEIHSVADGLTDTLVAWRGERDRPAANQSSALLAAVRTQGEGQPGLGWKPERRSSPPFPTVLARSRWVARWNMPISALLTSHGAPTAPPLPPGAGILLRDPPARRLRSSTMP